MHDYIAILSDINHFPQKALRLATLLAEGFGKEICFLSFAADEAEQQLTEERHQQWIDESAHAVISMIRPASMMLHEALTQIEVAFLVIEPISGSEYSKVQPILNNCKPLRIPYFFVNQHTTSISFDRVLVPVGFLTEEKEKGIFASKLARFCGSTITLLKAKDYGSRAERSVQQIQTLFEKLDISCVVEQARKDSFKVQQEASLRACKGDADMIVITASREYGLDDVLFGPPERKIIQNATVPVMVLNPRPDLYVLCD
jgi:nucleotide-binding universal stress UspA family protein